MSDVFAAQSLDFVGATLLFSDEEINDIDIRPVQAIQLRETQASDLRVYYKGTVHFEIDVQFRIARYDTLLRLYEIFQLRDSLVIYPHYPEDQVTAYTVVWTNPNNFVERWRKGYPRANYVIEATFREPSGSVCVPPS